MRYFAAKMQVATNSVKKHEHMLGRSAIGTPHPSQKKWHLGLKEKLLKGIFCEPTQRSLQSAQVAAISVMQHDTLFNTLETCFKLLLNA